MAHTDIASLTSLLADPDEMPDSHLLQRISAGEVQLQQLTEIAISAASQALRIAIALGQAFEILFRRHEGEFAEWLAGALPKKSDGSEFISEYTARKYRTLWRKRDLIFPPDDSEPACRSLTEAYIKVGLLPEPAANERDPHEIHAAFRLSFQPPTQPLDKLSPADLRLLLTRAEPVAKIYAEAREILASRS